MKTFCQFQFAIYMIYEIWGMIGVISFSLSSLFPPFRTAEEVCHFFETDVRMVHMGRTLDFP